MAKKSVSSGKPSGSALSIKEDLLIDNFVGLQKAMVNLSIKFEALSDNISRLLKVFEESARDYVEKSGSDNKELTNRLNSLLDQNKTIAKGLVLLEERMRSPSSNMMGSGSNMQQPSNSEGYLQSSQNSGNQQGFKPKPLPRL